MSLEGGGLKFRRCWDRRALRITVHNTRRGGDLDEKRQYASAVLCRLLASVNSNLTNVLHLGTPKDPLRSQDPTRLRCISVVTFKRICNARIRPFRHQRLQQDDIATGSWFSGIILPFCFVRGLISTLWLGCVFMFTVSCFPDLPGA
jgi:hypothetical protein